MGHCGAFLEETDDSGRVIIQFDVSLQTSASSARLSPHKPGSRIKPHAHTTKGRYFAHLAVEPKVPQLHVHPARAGAPR